MTTSEESAQGFNRRDALLLGTAGAAMFLFADLLQAVPAARATPVWHGGWGAPLNRSISVNTGFMATGPDYIEGQYHLGLDLFATADEGVYAIGTGVVVGIDADWEDGQAVYLRHTANDGTEFLGVYGHITTAAFMGQWFGAGAQIGTVQPQGDNTHFHFGLRTTPVVPAGDGGNIAVGDPRGSNGFTDPGTFLDAHPQSTTIPESDDMSIMIFKATVSGVGQHYFVMSPAGVHMGLEISANPGNKVNEDYGIGYLAYVAKLSATLMNPYNAPTITDQPGWPNVKAMAAKVCGMPSDYPLAPGTPFVAASYFNTNA